MSSGDTNQYDAATTLFSTFSDWQIAAIVCFSAAFCYWVKLHYSHKKRPTENTNTQMITIINSIAVIHKTVLKLETEFNRHINDRKKPLKLQIEEIQTCLLDCKTILDKLKSKK